MMSVSARLLPTSFAKLITLISFVTYYSLLCFMAAAARFFAVNCAVDAFTLMFAFCAWVKVSERKFG
jgi:hypothetical protein